MSFSTPSDECLLAPHSIPQALARQHQNATQRTIVIEPTPEFQQFYNKKRQEIDRQRLEIHVAKENVHENPLHADLVSCSTTSDGLRSPSTVYSHAVDGYSTLSQDLTAEATKSKPHRGRRKGPLDIETRIKTAFKRKFKLTCAFHREKKTSCNCHDFSKLEESYQSFLATEGQRTDDTQDRLASRRDVSSGSLGDLGTFGTGGAAQTTPLGYRGPELAEAELAIGDEQLTRLRRSYGPVVNFDIDSAASLNEIMSAPPGLPFYSAPVTMRDATQDLVLIGSRSPYCRNRWQCEYNYATEDTGSQALGFPCPWTGPLEQLFPHFNDEHSVLQPGTRVHWSMCAQCKTESHGLVREPACPRPNRCPSGSWQHWCYAVEARYPGRSVSTLSVSEATGGRSHLFDHLPNLSTPGSVGTEQSNLPCNYLTGNFGSYEQPAGWSGNRVDDETTSDSYPMLHGFPPGWNGNKADETTNDSYPIVHGFPPGF